MPSPCTIADSSAYYGMSQLGALVPRSAVLYHVVEPGLAGGPGSVLKGLITSITAYSSASG